MAELKNIEGKPDQELIRHLEWILEQAKAGKVVAIATVSMFSDTGMGNSWVCPGPREGNHLLSELERLKFELLLNEPDWRDNVWKKLCD